MSCDTGFVGEMDNQEEIDDMMLKGATHMRDDDYYRVTHKVETYQWDDQEWRDCDNPLDLGGWIDELEPIKKNAEGHALRPMSADKT